jgi:phosphinothricin acetyltransferase
VTPTTDQLVTSFSSKSELALNLSTGGRYVTFMGYLAPVDGIDVSNGSTPGVFDPTNVDPVTAYRVVAEVDSEGRFHFTETNDFSGDNPRAAILDEEEGANVIYAAGNGGKPIPTGIVAGGGAQFIAPSPLSESLQEPGFPTHVGSFSDARSGRESSAGCWRIRGMLVRHADLPRDAPACAAIYAPFVRDTPVSFEEQPPSEAEIARRIASVSEGYPWLVAEVAGEVAGYAYACPHRDRAAYRWAADVTVYVGEGRRGQGVGGALYSKLLPLLARQGLRIACAGITLPNDASVALHERFGFELLGIFRSIGWKAGAWRDVGWWQVELSPPTDGQPAEPGPPVRLEDAA